MEQSLIEDVKLASRLTDELQKLRIGIGNRILAKKKAKDNLVTERMENMFTSMRKLENESLKIAGELVEFTGLWDFFLVDVKGVGKKLASDLIAEIGDISKFPTVSSLWAYFGLTAQYVVCECSEGHKLIMSSPKEICPVFKDNEQFNAKRQRCNMPLTVKETVVGKAPKRKAGHHFLFKTRGRVLAWKLADEFKKQRTPYYRDIYDTEKEKQVNQGLKLGHAENRALRKAAKIFISHLWAAWRELENLEVREPYVIEKLGHRGFMGLAELRQILREGRILAKK